MQMSSERVNEMGRSLGELQRELEVMQECAEDRERRTELSLEELETLIAAKDEDTNRRLQEQAHENRETINKVRQIFRSDFNCERKVSYWKHRGVPRG